MSTIKVSIETIENTANKMEQKNIEFQGIYRKLISTVDNTSAFWKGLEQHSYVLQMKEFEKELVKLNALLNEYSSYLNKSAKSYRLTQEQLLVASKRLKIY